MSNRRVVTNVAFYYVAMKPNSQTNDVRCEYTRGAPESFLLQIPIDISQIIVINFVLAYRSLRCKMAQSHHQRPVIFDRLGLMGR